MGWRIENMGFHLEQIRNSKARIRQLVDRATDGRLWKLWETEEFSESEKLVYLFTCDNALVAKEDFAKLAIALRDFAAKYPPKGVCHLGAWADFLEASTAEAIGLHATTVTENPWFGWDE